MYTKHKYVQSFNFQNFDNITISAGEINYINFTEVKLRLVLT